MESSGFTTPEVKAALLLMQLSGDDSDDLLSTLKSDADNHNHSDDHLSSLNHNEDLHVLIKDLHKAKKRKSHKSKEENLQELCSGSMNNYSEDATSAVSGTNFFQRDQIGEDEEVASGVKRKMRKYLSLDELYSRTKPLSIKLQA